MSIIDPVTMKPHSLLGKVGRDLLKNYIRAFMTGGMEGIEYTDVVSPLRTLPTVSPTKSPDFKINPTERLSDDAVIEILNKYNIFRSITNRELNQLLKKAPLITEIISFMKINLKNIRFNNVLNAIKDLEYFPDQDNWLVMTDDVAKGLIEHYLDYNRRARQLLSSGKSYEESTLDKIYDYFRIGGDYKVKKDNLEDIKKNSKEEAKKECINFIYYTENETIDLNDLSRKLSRKFTDEEKDRFNEYYNTWKRTDDKISKERINKEIFDMVGVSMPSNIKIYFYDNYIIKEELILELFNDLCDIIISPLTDSSDNVKKLIHDIIIDYLLFKILANKFNFGIGDQSIPPFESFNKMEKKYLDEATIKLEGYLKKLLKRYYDISTEISATDSETSGMPYKLITSPGLTTYVVPDMNIVDFKLISSETGNWTPQPRNNRDINLENANYIFDELLSSPDLSSSDLSLSNFNHDFIMLLFIICKYEFLLNREEDDKELNKIHTEIIKFIWETICIPVINSFTPHVTAVKRLSFLSGDSEEVDSSDEDMDYERKKLLLSTTIETIIYTYYYYTQYIIDDIKNKVKEPVVSVDVEESKGGDSTDYNYLGAYDDITGGSSETSGGDLKPVNS